MDNAEDKPHNLDSVRRMNAIVYNDFVVLFQPMFFIQSKLAYLLLYMGHAILYHITNDKFKLSGQAIHKDVE